MQGIHKNKDTRQAKLESLLRRSGYKAVTLQNIMRKSANITSATSPNSMNKYNFFITINSISSGSCSTVTGTRPTCYLYKDNPDVNYEEIARCANKYLEPNSEHLTKTSEATPN